MKLAANILVWAVAALSALATVTYVQAMFAENVGMAILAVQLYTAILAGLATLLGLAFRRALGGAVSRAANAALITGLIGFAVLAISLLF